MTYCQWAWEVRGPINISPDLWSNSVKSAPAGDIQQVCDRNVQGIWWLSWLMSQMSHLVIVSHIYDLVQTGISSGKKVFNGDKERHNG